MPDEENDSEEMNNENDSGIIQLVPIADPEKRKDHNDVDVAAIKSPEL